MKRYVLRAIVISAIAVTAVWNASLGIKSNDLSNVILANVEALTSGEGGSSSNWDCWSQEKSGNGYWRCGNPCKWIDGVGGKGSTSKCYAN